MKFNKIYVIVALSIFYLLFHILVFRNTDILQYPFMHQDIWKRLQDGLYYSNGYTEPAFHPPIVSFVYALFYLLDSTKFYFFHFFTFVFSLFTLYTFVKYVTKNQNIAIISSVFYFFNFYTLQYFNYIGLVDSFTASLITLCFYFYLRFEDEQIKKWLYLCGFTIGIAALTQYSGIFVLPILIIYRYLKDKKSLFSKENYVLGLISLSLFSTLFIYRLIVFQNPIYTKVEHFGFLRLHFDDLGYYLWYFVVYFSLPVTIIFISGLYKAVVRKNKNILKIFGLFLPIFIFFWWFYTWEDIRFITYIAAPVYMIVGIELYEIYKYVKNIRKKLFTFYFLFFTLLLYTNIHNQGEPSVPITPLHSIKLSDRHDGYKYYQVPELSKANEYYLPYFIYTADYKNHVKIEDCTYPPIPAKDEEDIITPDEILDLISFTKPKECVKNYELNYYLNDVSPRFTKEVVDFIGKENYKNTALKLNWEKFVRYNQFVVFFEHEIAFKLFRKDEPVYKNYQFIITDHELDQNEYSEYQIVFRNEKFNVYDKGN